MKRNHREQTDRFVFKSKMYNDTRRNVKTSDIVEVELRNT